MHFFYYEEYLEFYLRLKKGIENSNIKEIFTLNEAKRCLIKNMKMRMNDFCRGNILIEKIWDNMRLQKKFIDNNFMNIKKFLILKIIISKDLSKIYPSYSKKKLRK